MGAFQDYQDLSFKEGPKKSVFFQFTKISVSGVANSSPPKITLKIAYFDPNFTLRVPKSHKNPGVGSKIWKSFKKRVFWGSFP